MLTAQCADEHPSHRPHWPVRPAPHRPPLRHSFSEGGCRTPPSGLTSSDALAPITSHIRPLFVLAIMELEAWFIAEWSHFARINSREAYVFLCFMAGSINCSGYF